MTTVDSIKANIATTMANLKANRETLKRLKAELYFAKNVAAESKAAMQAIKAQDREAKKAARIAKLEAKLLAMKTPKVGTKAKKASRKPGPVTITKVYA